MPRFSLRPVIGAATCLLAGLAAASLTGPAQARLARKPAAKPNAQIAQGKALVSQLRCNGCHAADLKGKPHFSPSLRASGELRHYTKKSFETVMDTGITPQGRPVEKPMPVYHLPKAKSDALFAYLLTQK